MSFDHLVLRLKHHCSMKKICMRIVILVCFIILSAFRKMMSGVGYIILIHSFLQGCSFNQNERRLITHHDASIKFRSTLKYYIMNLKFNQNYKTKTSKDLISIYKVFLSIWWGLHWWDTFCLWSRSSATRYLITRSSPSRPRTIIFDPLYIVAV